MFGETEGREVSVPWGPSLQTTQLVLKAVAFSLHLFTNQD